ncbi:21488_t:CDS:1, partial [Gigaspora margarita]
TVICSSFPSSLSQVFAGCWVDGSSTRQEKVLTNYCLTKDFLS